MSDPGRIVLAIRAGSDARFVADAGDLARALHTELAALFVEEVELVRLAHLPFIREIGVASGSELQFDAAAIARRHQRQAAAVRSQVARTASALGLPWSFDVTHGSLLEVALRLTGPDLLVLEPQPSAVQHVLGRAAGVRALRPAPAHEERARRDVAVLYVPTAAGGRALAVAARLAAGGPLAATVVLEDLAAAGAARREAAAAFGIPQSGVNVALLRELRQGDCARALVVPLEVCASRPAALRALRATVPCPLVLVH